MENQIKTRNVWRRCAGMMLAVGAMAFMVAPVVAYAQSDDPSCAVYGSDIPGGSSEVCGNVPFESSSDTASGLNQQIGALPFTGLDLLILAGVALVLTGTGFALRRLSTPRGPTF